MGVAVGDGIGVSVEVGNGFAVAVEEGVGMSVAVATLLEGVAVGWMTA